MRFHKPCRPYLVLFLEFSNIWYNGYANNNDSANQSKKNIRTDQKQLACPHVHMSPEDSTRDVLLDASSELILCSCPHIPCGCFCHRGIYSAMVISCRAVGCTNKQSKDNMAFYLMPKYMERKQKWIIAIYHKYWQLAKYTRHPNRMGKMLLLSLINSEAWEVRISYLIWFHVL